MIHYFSVTVSNTLCLSHYLLRALRLNIPAVHTRTDLLICSSEQGNKKIYSSYVTINLESFQEEQTCKM